MGSLFSKTARADKPPSGVVKPAARPEEARSDPNVGKNNFYCHGIFRFDTKIRDM